MTVKALWVSTNNGSFPAQEDSEPLAFGARDTIFVRATVANGGSRSSKWPVILFVGDSAAIMPPSPAIVKGFTTVELDAGEEASVDFQVRLL